MPTTTADEQIAREERTRRRRTWSGRRTAISALALVLTATAAGLFAWRAAQSPLQLWAGASQCSVSPHSKAGQLFGLASSPALVGATDVRIIDVSTLAATGAAPPTYWVVPVTDRSAGTGTASTDAPPPHWGERVPADGADFRVDAPSDLVAELHPRGGRATLDGVRVTYRTPDGFIHTADIDPETLVSSARDCAAGAGQP